MKEMQRILDGVLPQLQAEGFVRNIESTIGRRDGTKFPGLMNFTLSYAEGGQPELIIVILYVTS